MPRWSAERRARPAGRAAAPEAQAGGNGCERGAAPRDSCAYRRSASLYFLEAELGTGLAKLGRGCVARTRSLAPYGRRWNFVSRAQRSTISAFTRVFDALWRSGVVRCRPGIVTNSESTTIPDQRCTASRCTASGKRRQDGERALNTRKELIMRKRIYPGRFTLDEWARIPY